MISLSKFPGTICINKLIFPCLLPSIYQWKGEMMPREIKKEYSNGDITVVWKPHLCMHSTKCWKALLPVFDPRRKPWIDMKAAATDDIIKTVNTCPSNALSFYRKHITSNDEDRD